MLWIRQCCPNLFDPASHRKN